jgi:hypothetical protein
MKKYKTLIYVESLFTSLMPGYSALNSHTFTAFLNEHADNGWRVVSVTPVTHRAFLFIKHAAFAVIFEFSESDTHEV